MHNDVEIYIFFTLNKKSLVSRYIALYSFYRCILKKSVFESIKNTILEKFPGKIKVRLNEGKVQTFPLFVFSHTGLLFRIKGSDKYYILEINNKYGIDLREDDLRSEPVKVKT